MNATSHFYDVIILGAGASGLMCAIQAGQRGRSVLVLEKANKVGKKILMSGGGKCNFTNMNVENEHYISHNPHFVISALSQYTQWDFIQWVCDANIAYEERKHGQLFTLNGSKEILNALLAQCQQANVNIETSCQVLDVQKVDEQFYLTTSLGNFQAQSLVIATGGLSIPSLGGSGFGYQLAEQFGHHVYPTRAGLVPFCFSDYVKEISTRLSGNAVDVIVENERASFTEALLFTHRGLSGPSILQLSNYWQQGEAFYVNFLPTLDLVEHFKYAKQQHPKMLLRSILNEHLPKNLVLEFQARLWHNHADTPIAEISDQFLQNLAQQLQHYALKPSDTEGYRTAEVTLGGVDTNEVSSKTMQSKKVQGLYLIGEVLDVTGWLGGYNFQWAWSSGYVAGQYV
ncbi:MAG: NAD(P)/FAD-dependent oxidoreductase [Acinetobacter sp.]|nr:NAD(P)/FAD-dependent oxidoreductase [Acinetobacter sp.]